jgi:hypothetical protein
MTPYIKYYFTWKEDRLSLDSVGVSDDCPLTEPPDFLKWYEEGDLAKPEITEEDKLKLLRTDSPVYWAMFAPRKVNFSVEQILKQRSER